MTFLFKPRRGEWCLLVDDDQLRVNWEERTRAARTVDVGGVPVAAVVEHDGWNKSRIRLWTTRYQTARGDHSGGNGIGRHVAATAAGVKTALRRLRPEEAEQLATLDAEIAQLLANLDDCRQSRVRVLERAWQRAHVTRLAELVERIPEER